MLSKIGSNRAIKKPSTILAFWRLTRLAWKIEFEIWVKPPKALILRGFSCLSTPHIPCGYFPGSNRLLLGKKTPAIPIFKFFRLKHDEQRVDLRPSAAALLPSLSRPKAPYLRAFCSLSRVRKYEQYQRTSRLSLTCSYYAAFIWCWDNRIAIDNPTYPVPATAIVYFLSITYFLFPSGWTGIFSMIEITVVIIFSCFSQCSSSK